MHIHYSTDVGYRWRGETCLQPVYNSPSSSGSQGKKRPSLNRANLQADSLRTRGAYLHWLRVPLGKDSRVKDLGWNFWSLPSICLHYSLQLSANLLVNASWNNSLPVSCSQDFFSMFLAISHWRDSHLFCGRTPFAQVKANLGNSLKLVPGNFVFHPQSERGRSRCTT